MTEKHRPVVNRRLLLELGLGLGTVAAAGQLWPSIAGETAGAIPALLEDVCDRVIPATGTPGAVAARVPEFVLRALSVGIAGAKGDELDRLATELDKDYMTAADAERQRMLVRHDAAAFAGATPQGAWPTIKKLIILGYYSSEIGGSQELQYELDPGGFKPDLPYSPGDRAWSNDWFAVLP